MDIVIVRDIYVCRTHDHSFQDPKKNVINERVSYISKCNCKQSNFHYKCNYHAYSKKAHFISKIITGDYSIRILSFVNTNILRFS